MSKRTPWAVLLSTALIPLGAWAEGDAAPKDAKPEKVTKLNGTSFFGIVEVTDDYTIRVKSDTGIQKVPITQLGDKDFKKYGFGKDRSKDGKFWSERQDALEQEKESEGDSKTKGDDKAAIEVRLTEIEAFQPLIDAYEKNLADKKKDEATEKEQKPKGEETEGRSLFSKTGIPGLGDKPFSGMGSSAVQPAASAGASAVQAIGTLPGAGAVPGGLPSAP